MEKSNNISESHKFSFTADNLRNAVWGTNWCTPLSSANHLISWGAQNTFYNANNTSIKKELTNIAVENHLVEICYLLLFFFFFFLLLLNGRILISTKGYVSFLSYGVNKTPHSSRTFRRILLVCVKTVVCNSVIFVSIPVALNLFSRTLPGVTRAPTPNWNTFIFIFHTFFSSLPRSKYLSIFSTSLPSTLASHGIAKSIIWNSGCSLSITIMSRLLAVIKWSVSASKSQRILHESFSITGPGWCSYRFGLTWIPFAPQTSQ